MFLCVCVNVFFCVFVSVCLSVCVFLCVFVRREGWGSSVSLCVFFCVSMYLQISYVSCLVDSNPKHVDHVCLL